jgi:hypothetical protein
MKNPKPRRVTQRPDAQRKARLRRAGERIARELPDLVSHDQMRKEASEESTLSGELRKAVHASPLSLTDIAHQAGLSSLALDEFLTGERTLRSDVLDRLAKLLGLVLAPQKGR